jgi:hypothetical protein
VLNLVVDSVEVDRKSMGEGRPKTKLSARLFKVQILSVSSAIEGSVAVSILILVMIPASFKEWIWRLQVGIGRFVRGLIQRSNTNIRFRGQSHFEAQGLKSHDLPNFPNF